LSKALPQRTRTGRWRVLLKNTGPSPVGKTLRFDSEPEQELRIVEQHERASS